MPAYEMMCLMKGFERVNIKFKIYKKKKKPLKNPLIATISKSNQKRC
jgi:hypothetical protein